MKTAHTDNWVGIGCVCVCGGGGGGGGGGGLESGTSSFFIFNVNFIMCCIRIDVMVYPAKLVALCSLNKLQ